MRSWAAEAGAVGSFGPAAPGNLFGFFVREHERNTNFGMHEQGNLFELWTIHYTTRNVFVDTLSFNCFRTERRSDSNTVESWALKVANVGMVLKQGCCKEEATYLVAHLNARSAGDIHRENAFPVTEDH